MINNIQPPVIFPLKKVRVSITAILKFKVILLVRSLDVQDSDILLSLLLIKSLYCPLGIGCSGTMDMLYKLDVSQELELYITFISTFNPLGLSRVA